MSLNTYPYNPFPASTDKLDEAHNAELQLEVDQLKEDVEKLETDKTDTAVMAPAFDTETGVYAVGDLVMYQGKLYEFTSAHETAGDWDPTEVTEKTVADEIGDVKSGLTKQTTVISETNAVGNAYNIAGVICLAIYDGGQFSCNANDVIFTLPAGFRPSVEVQVVNTASGHERILINSSGQVIAKEAFNNSYARFTITFVS